MEKNINKMWISFGWGVYRSGAYFYTCLFSGIGRFHTGGAKSGDYSAWGVPVQPEGLFLCVLKTSMTSISSFSI
ncbi:hypothetical protein CJD36_004585 [Flavipsychrobacter stenotrophus]|uniref:Uncharacterized protein n=1 Tax=Flavipsychrobacter stenotrophus TaxID=2077091 RepID=A0A2S7T2N9_9BACT|nr:hypothetical protein [Flavipsychrobacter stenotrophus]PQJ13026.1 hypothetical protein CJD36_004585 [Flavipsychrobacter stenotrophus]